MRTPLPSRRAETVASRAGSAGSATQGKPLKPWCQCCGAPTPEPRRRTFAPDRDGSRCVAILVCPRCDDWYAELEWLRWHWRA